ncbi:MAG: hypothetical protein AABY22_09070, partial [Nanoarchaeota archaeon]
MEELAQNSAEIVRPLHDENGDFAKGHKKIGGKELGTNNFDTDFDALVDTIAKEEGLTKSEVKRTLLRVGYEHAKRGVFPFWKD